MKHAPDGLVQGGIVSQLGIPPTNLPFYLKATAQSGLVNVNADY